MTCSNCGTWVKDGVTMCPKCGRIVSRKNSMTVKRGQGAYIRPENRRPSDAGKGEAIASLVLGICSVVCWFFGISSLLSLIFGIIGIALSSRAKQLGYDGGMRTAGFILSIIGLVGGAIIFVACVACVGGLSALLHASVF